MTEKNTYQHHISVYKKRKKKLGIRQGKVISPSMRGQVDRLNRKISTWRKAIKRIEKYQERLKILERNMEEFSGLVVREIGSKKDPLSKAVRGIFCKWGLEVGIMSKYLASSLGVKRQSIPTYRMRFIQSFSTSSYNKDMWYRFKEFLKDVED